MPIATGLAIGLGAAAAAGSVGSAAIGAHAAGKAASAQRNSANYAADLQYKTGQNALQFQEGQYNNTLGMEMPYYNAGVSGLTNLENLMGILPSSASSTRIPNPQPLNVGMPGNPSGAPRQFQPSSTLPNTSHLINGGPMSAIGNNGTPMPSAGGPQTARAMTAPVNGIPGGPVVQGPVSANGNGAIGPTFAPNAATSTGANPAASPGSPSAPIPNSLSSLINPALGASGSLMTPFLTPFQAPTGATEQNDPGYQFRLKQGTQALDNSAAARGDLLSGNTLQGVTQFGQDYASNEYGNVYNRALQQYQLAQNNSTNIFNRLADVSGLGQTALQQIANTGTAAGGQVGSTLNNTAALMGQDYQNAGAATASGYVGAGNAYSGALGSLSNLAMLPYLSHLMNQNQG